MFRKLLNKTRFVRHVIQRNSAYYCLKSSTPVIPACFWTVLPNGVKVISEHICSDLASVSLLIETGPYHENPCNNGITYFIERLAYHGFNSLSKSQLECKIRCIGARLSCKTTREYQLFTAACPPSCIEYMLEIFYKILYDMNYNCSIESAMEDLYEDLVDVENDPRKLCFDYLHTSAFQGTPLGNPVIGPLGNYSTFSSSYIADFICDNYRPERIVLSLSGACTHNQFVCMAGKTFGLLPYTECVAYPPPARFTGSQVLFRHDGMPFSHTAIAVEAPGMASNMYLQFRIMTEIIGAWDKSQGTEYRSWPEAAQYSAMADLCETYEAFYIPYKDVGLFGVYFVASNGKFLDDMVYNIQNQLMKMCNMLTSTECQRAGNRVKLKLAKEIEGCLNSSADQAIQMHYFGFRKNICAQMETLSGADSLALSVTSLANDYIYDKCIACASVGPTESLPDYNRLRSSMYWLRT